MKIIFCTHRLDYSGGIERVLIEKVNYLKIFFNYEILIVVTMDEGRNIFFDLDKNIKVENLNINYNTLDKISNKIYKKIIYRLKQMQHLKKLKKLVNIYQPDILISTGDQSISLCIDKKIKAFKLLENHLEKNTFLVSLNKDDSLIKYYYKKIKRYLKFKNIEKYDKFIVLTNEDKEQWLNEKEIKNIEVIPNPLSFYPKEISKCKNKTIISVGRLAEQKGYKELIEVWSKLFKKYPDWKLEIYGEGPLKKKLQEKIDILGMTNSLLLKGTDKRIMERYLESSIYVMTSKYEGFGMVLVEAMACGLPVVSFDCPCGPKDIIKDGEDGFLIRNRDLDGMAKKLEFLIKNENQRKIMGKKAHENIARYSKEKVMLQWKNLFEELVNKKENKL